MSSLRHVPSLVLLAMLAACGEGNDPLSAEPSESMPIDAPEVVAATANGGAVVERGETSFTVDFVGDWVSENAPDLKVNEDSSCELERRR